MSQEPTPGRPARPASPESEPAVVSTAQTEWGRVLARSLRDAGVSRVIASPGSRSTPLLAAFLAEGLDVRDVVDERAAAFVALGHARVGGEPVAVLCTSGTAPAHWFPAVLEAELSGVPMVLISADRPTELSLCGAAQTVDQVKLFGDHVRFFADAGNPDADEAALAGLRRLVGQAVAASRGPIPGPVHLNVRARKPLEPRAPTTRAEHALRAMADDVLARPLSTLRTEVRAHDDEIARLARTVEAASRILVVAGPLPPTADVAPLHALLGRIHGVLAAELTSQLRFSSPEQRAQVRLDSLDGWLGAGLFASDPPDLVIELGGVATSAAYERWVARARPRRVVLGGVTYRDPHASAEQIVLGDVAAIATRLLERLVVREARAETRAFHEQAQRLEEVAREQARQISEGWGEPAIARTVARLVPAGGRLVVGNSLPIRMLDRYASADVRSTPLSVVHQRGANGIDGLVAQSFGAVLADPRPTVALLGDLTLLHDVGALAVARGSATPLAIVVVDNAGGRIFESLPVAREAGWMMPHMTTPSPIDHGALARAFGIEHADVEDVAGLEHALTRASNRPGLTLVRARVEAGAARAPDAELARRVASLWAEHERVRRWPL